MCYLCISVLYLKEYKIQIYIYIYIIFALVMNDLSIHLLHYCLHFILGIAAVICYSDASGF